MKIVADEMGGIKVGSFGEKSKEKSVGQLAVGQLDSWTVGSWTKRSGESTIRRTGEIRWTDD
jgi:hypothetical protein